MRVLLIGNDGRVYALARNMSWFGHRLAVVGGREYMDYLFDPVVRADPTDATAILSTAESFCPDLIVPVGYETGYHGIVDRLRTHGYRVFGASRAGVHLEASKEYGMDKVEAAGVSVAPFLVVHDAVEARAVARAPEFRVVKRIGFAGGQGVKVLRTAEETVEQACRVIEQDSAAIIQQRIAGVPVNLVWVQTPAGPVPLCMQTDYKRTYTGDLGPFCGAMGATVWHHVPARVVREMIMPLSKMLSSIGYIGRVGLDCMYEMATGRLHAIEWTARLGTPTTETMLAAWDDDVASLFAAWHDGEHVHPKMWFKDSLNVSVGVAIAGGGYPYPDAVKQGLPVTVAGPLSDIVPIGVEGRAGALRTKGGRHFVATGVGEDIVQAKQAAYAAVARVSFTDMVYRTDIGDDMLASRVFETLEERWS